MGKVQCSCGYYFIEDEENEDLNYNYLSAFDLPETLSDKISCLIKNNSFKDKSLDQIESQLYELIINKMGKTVFCCPKCKSMYIFSPDNKEDVMFYKLEK